MIDNYIYHRTISCYIVGNKTAYIRISQATPNYFYGSLVINGWGCNSYRVFTAHSRRKNQCFLETEQKAAEFSLKLGEMAASLAGVSASDIAQKGEHSRYEVYRLSKAFGPAEMLIRQQYYASEWKACIVTKDQDGIRDVLWYGEYDALQKCIDGIARTSAEMAMSVGEVVLKAG